MQNLEIKTPIGEPDALLGRLSALGATRQWTRRQRDVFFVVPRGYLKLRVHDPGEAELIAYEREAGTHPRPSDYVVVPVADAAGLEAALGRSLGVRGVVEKSRTLHLWRHTRIHLDEVAGLGAFLELETVLSGISRSEGEAEIRAVIAGLDLDPSRFLAVPYLELLEGGG